MRFISRSSRQVVVLAIAASAVAIAVRLQAQAGAAPQAPTGPLAPEKYKNIQVLTDVPADQLELTMQYFGQATGIQCQGCHVQDPATHQFTYDKDDNRTKQTARRMISLVKTVNAGNFGIRIQCSTCHQGHNQPPALTMAVPFTDDQLAALAAQAARQGGQGRGGAAAPGAPGAGRAQAPAAPAVADVVAKYVDALGGQAALQKLQSRVVTGTWVNRQRRSLNVTIEEKNGKLRRSAQGSGPSMGFDGTAGWSQDAATVSDLTGFPLLSIAQAADLMQPLQLTDHYQLQAARPRPLPGTQTTVNVLQGAPVVSGSPVANTTVTFYFDATSGLLIRRVLSVRTPMGTLSEQTDFADYRPAGGVKMPYSIKVATPQTIDEVTVSDIKVNTAIDDARFARPKG
jgi:hypothetical protein